MSRALWFGCATQIALLGLTIVAVVSWGCAAPVGGGDGNDNNGNSNGNDNGNDHGGGGWQEVAELFAEEPGEGDRFGNSVAVDGDTILVGASSTNQNQGAAYAFRNLGGEWEFEAQFLGEEIFNPQAFGESVAIVGDTAFVGAYNYAPEGSFEFQIGAVYVFQRAGRGGWIQVDLLTASDFESQDYLGFAIAADGDVLVAGAWGRDNLRGVAYVFRNVSGHWVEEQRLEASDGINFDRLGQSVAIDGNTIVLGAPVQDFGTGAVYVFEHDGQEWAEADKLLAPVTRETDQFGFAVAIQGDTIVASSALRDGDGVLDAGEAYVFTRSGGDWTYQQTLTAEDADIGRIFGTSVAIDDDLIAIGAPVVSQVYVFQYDGSTWRRIDQLMPAASDIAYDLFGTSVAVQDGVIVGGALTSAEAGTATSGAAYVFAP